MKTLRRASTNRVLGGVCGGIAEYLSLDPILIRLIFVVMAIFGGAGIVIYFIAWIIMPEKGVETPENSSDSEKRFGNNIQDAEISDDEKKTNDSLNQNIKNVTEEISKEFEKAGKKIEKELEIELKKHRHSSGAWFGIFLIFLGTAFLLRMLGWLHFSWCGILQFWPILLIFLGISVIPMKRWLKNILMILCLTGLLFAMICNSQSGRCLKHRSTTCSVNSSKNNMLTLETSRKGENAELQIDLGAATLTLSEITEHLSEVWINGEKRSFVEFLNEIEQREKFRHQTNRTERGNQLVNLRLNKNPIWDIELNIGAASVNMDLSAFKVNEIDINSGAADMDLTIGTKHPTTQIDINTGASNTKIRIPKDADCNVISGSVLMSKKLDGFVKSGNTYKTENFGSAAQTITIKIDGAVGSFEIIRY